MPNWAFNNLEVKGKEADRKKFASDHHHVQRRWEGDEGNADLKTELDFGASVWDEDNKNHPYSQYGYDWQITHWGTKWNACEVETHDDGVMLYYTFETAWSPPHEWIMEASKKYPNLTFTLTTTEEADQYLFGVEVKNGEAVKCLEVGDVRSAVMEYANFSLEERVMMNRSDWWDNEDLRVRYNETQHEILGDKESW